MKPAPFEYVRPQSLAAVCELLANDEDARVIAGGQTLVPMLAMRLARPARLIDIARLPELSGIREDNGAIVIGATTRQVIAERSELVRRSLPLLTAALPWVGHPPTRNRGTVGGSIANADPSAEIPLVAVTLGAEIEITSTDGVTTMPADDFFIGPMLTVIGQGECVSAVRFPVWTHKNVGVGFHEISARRSDFAFVSAAAQVALDDDGKCVELALGVGGASERPLPIDVAPLIGSKLEQSRVTEAVEAATASLETMDDLHASAAYRRRVAATLCARALLDARDNAGGRKQGAAR